MFYEYRCKNSTCPQFDQPAEVEHPMNLSPEVKCIQCGNIMEKQITGGAGVQFKGSGWTPKHHSRSTKKTISPGADPGGYGDIGKPEDYTE